jgi:hypothetical protein
METPPTQMESQGAADAPEGTKAPQGEEGLSCIRCGFWDKYGSWLFLGGFTIYLILLIIGVIAEIFDIESILDWWIWRPPGKPPLN